MKEIVSWASIYILTIALGYFLKRIHVFEEKDKKIFSNLIGNVTLPAMLISSFNGVTPSFWYIVAMFLSIGLNITLVLAAMLVSRRKSKELQAMYIINGSGFNFGNIAIPYLSNFLADGIPYLCMFDIGDSFISLGTSYALGQLKLGRAADNPVKAVLKSLSHSVSFLAYIAMLLLSFFHIILPDYFMDLAGFMGKANGFLAMIMIGISFPLQIKKETIKDIFTIIVTRYLVGAVAAVLIFFLLPAPPVMRQILATAVFAGVPNVALMYTIKLDVSTDMAAALAPISTILSIVTLSVAMLIFTNL